MATKLETQTPAQTPAATPAQKPAKVKKTPPTALQRVSEILKRAALQKKISAEELDSVANLAAALKTFLAA